jgi:hypothetical protein
MISTDTATPGTTGAKRQSYAGANPREVLLRTAKRYEDEEETRHRVWSIVSKEPTMMRTIYEYWFANNYKSLGTPRHGRRPAADIAKATAAVRSRIEAHIEREVRVRLLDLLMPNGKTLGASTREELAALGGWAMRIADRLQPGQTVEQAGLTEDDLRKLYSEPV